MEFCCAVVQCNLTSMGWKLTTVSSTVVLISTVLLCVLQLSCAQTPRACQEVSTYGSEVTTERFIDPDGPGGVEGFMVICNFSDGSTIVEHKQDETGDTSGEWGGRFRIWFTYEPSMEQIGALTDVSQHCYQYVKFRCKKSEIWRRGIILTWWESRDGVKMYNWGGAPAGHRGCACSYDGDVCLDPNDKCNCDIDDNYWREDGGMLRDKDLLPVTKLLIGDLNHSGEKAEYTVGPLICEGIGQLEEAWSSTSENVPTDKFIYLFTRFLWTFCILKMAGAGPTKTVFWEHGKVQSQRHSSRPRSFPHERYTRRRGGSWGPAALRPPDVV